jgi:hypothetical protein
VIDLAREMLRGLQERPFKRQRKAKTKANNKSKTRKRKARATKTGASSLFGTRK